MYLMYVDESGDSGAYPGSPTRFFTLTGLVVHESRWVQTLDSLVRFRQVARSRFGIQLAEEIHAGEMLSRPGKLVRIKKNDRLAIIRGQIDLLATMNHLNIINIRVDKQGKPAGCNPFVKAWEALIQRFENTLANSNFPAPKFAGDMGIIFCDQTDEGAVRKLYRKMRVFNPVPNMGAQGFRQMPLRRIVEDPNLRPSHHSYFIQAVDVAAFAMYQYYSSSAYVRKKGVRNYFNRLNPILCKVASRAANGVVEL